MGEAISAHPDARRATVKEATMHEDVAGMQVFYQFTQVELPLEVVPDWDEQVRHATEVCRLIDRHLDHEAGSRGLSDSRKFCPRYLCPEQRIQMITHVYAVVERAVPGGPHGCGEPAAVSYSTEERGAADAGTRLGG